MIFNQASELKKTLPAWVWLVVFLISISGTFYLGLNPKFITQYWQALVGYNVVMSSVAVFYILIDIKHLKNDLKENIIGSRFTWSFIKIVPILVIVPVLSFYLFSFQSIQENVRNSEKTFDAFNAGFIQQVDGLYQGVQKVRDDRYTSHSRDLLDVITSYGNFQKDSKRYKSDMQIFLDGLIDKGWACQISLFDHEAELVAKTADIKSCASIEDHPLPDAQTYTINEDEKSNVIQVKMSTRYITRAPTKDFLAIDVLYTTDPNLLSFLRQVRGFSDRTKTIQFSANTAVTQKRFLIDFSSTVLLAILSVLMIVFRMMDHLMKPLHNLSLATREIAKGNYDVQVDIHEENKDMQELIKYFNQMSRQIESSREDLDTHNLYLETILKYSYGVIGLDRKRRIRLINPVIGKMLHIEDEKEFVGKLCDSISSKYKYLKPLFDMTVDKFKQDLGEWEEQLDVSLPERHILLTCQGTALDTHDKTLGYVIIIKDISQLHRAQKKAAWGEVAVRMAHEIKNPLTPILLSAQRLRNKFLETLKGKDLEIIDKTTNTIIEQVKSMDKMVTAFAEYANTPQVERKPSDLNALINQTISLYDAQSNINIELDLSGNLPDLLLDANSISRVLINLVKNAAESIEDERELAIKIVTQYLTSEGIVRLSIQDNGDGFDEEVIDRVFEPYVTTKVKGSGLGMAIVQNIIEQHDGRIFAGNVQPHGAMVTIEFDYKE
jgi:Signal transduction histidine kinase involved in nitrogen fixation and metabolism regulation